MLVMVTLVASTDRIYVECEGKKETKLTLWFMSEQMEVQSGY